MCVLQHTRDCPACTSIAAAAALLHRNAFWSLLGPRTLRLLYLGMRRNVEIIELQAEAEKEEDDDEEYESVVETVMKMERIVLGK